MQSNTFVGNVAADITLSTRGNRKYCRFTLIENRVGAVDEETGERKEYTTALPLVAFGARAETIAKHVRKGDQLHVKFDIRNDNYDKDNETVYAFSFIMQEFEFGKPGSIKRAELADRGNQESD